MYKNCEIILSADVLATFGIVTLVTLNSAAISVSYCWYFKTVKIKTLTTFRMVIRVMELVWKVEKEKVTSNFLAPFTFWVSSVALLRSPDKESAKWRAALSWSSVSTQSRSSIISTSRHPSTEQSAKLNIIVFESPNLDHYCTVDFFPSNCFIPKHLDFDASHEKLTKLW